jgi:hypothetical protein
MLIRELVDIQDVMFEMSFLLSILSSVSVSLEERSFATCQTNLTMLRCLLLASLHCISSGEIPSSLARLFLVFVLSPEYVDLWSSGIQSFVACAQDSLHRVV